MEYYHTIEEIIGQCKLRWELSDDFSDVELKNWIDAADTILSDVQSQKALSPIMQSLLKHCIHYIEKILPLRPDISGDFDQENQVFRPDNSYDNYDENYNIFLESLHNEIENYFRENGFFS